MCINESTREVCLRVSATVRENFLLYNAIDGQMTEVKGVGRRRQRRRRRQLLDDLRNRRRYWELKEEAEIEIDGDDSLSIEHKEEIHIFHKSMDLLISSILINQPISESILEFL